MKSIVHNFKIGWLLVLLMVTTSYLYGTNPQDPDCDPCKLEVVLNSLSEHYSVLFSYKTKLVKDVDVSFHINENENFNTALNRLLNGLNLEYKSIDSKYYLIFSANNTDKKSIRKMERKLKSLRNLEQDTGIRLFKKPDNDNVALKELYESTQTRFEGIAIEGTVTDQDGEPLIGVNIQVKGTNKGTATDFDGHFTLKNVNEDAVLVISYIGYKTQEVSIAGKSNISITLVSDSQLLDEVVVVGYGTSQKKDLTGAVTRVNLENNRLQPNVNPIQNLRGTVAGVNVVDNGRPGSDASITIRGKNSISASNRPLIVLDGIIYSGGSLSDINSNDIESIDILKDASASAIYGSLAANGVILITTKKGTTDKPRISFNTYYGMSDFAHIPEYLDADEYIQVRKDAEKADGGPIPFSPLEQANIDAGKTIEPFEEIKQDAPVYSNELSVSGRSDLFRYYFSGSHTSIKSPIMGDNFSRIGARVNLSANVTDWLTVGTNSGYSSKDNSGIRADLARAGYLSPYANLYYDDGVPRPLPMNVGLVGNPLTETLLNDNLDKSNTLFTNTYINVELPLDGLSFRINAGYTQRTERRFSTSEVEINHISNPRI